MVWLKEKQQVWEEKKIEITKIEKVKVCIVIVIVGDNFLITKLFFNKQLLSQIIMNYHQQVWAHEKKQVWKNEWKSYQVISNFNKILTINCSFFPSIEITIIMISIHTFASQTFKLLIML